MAIADQLYLQKPCCS